MPGAKCAFPDCGVTRREQFSSLAIFQVPKRTGEFYTKWRKDTLDVLQKYRGVDATFRERLKNGEVFICERYYLPEDIVFTSKFEEYMLFSFRPEKVSTKYLGVIIDKHLTWQYHITYLINNPIS